MKMDATVPHPINKSVSKIRKSMNQFAQIKDSLDKGIRKAVGILMANEVETFESCQGGAGHCFPEPTIHFYGNKNEGIRVAYICLQENLPIFKIGRAFHVSGGEITTPFWEVVFISRIPKGQLFVDEETQTFKI